MNYFSIQLSTVNNIADKEKQMAAEFSSIISNVSSARNTLTGNSALKENVRFSWNAALDDLFSQQENLSKLGTMLGETAAEYVAVEKSISTGLLLQSVMDNITGVIGTSWGSGVGATGSGIKEWLGENVTWETLGTGDFTYLEALFNGGLDKIAGSYSVLSGFDWLTEVDLSDLSTGNDQQMLLELLNAFENNPLKPGLITGESICEGFHDLFDSGKNWYHSMQDSLSYAKEQWDNFMANPIDAMQYFDEKVDLPKELKFVDNVLKFAGIGVGLYTSYMDYREGAATDNRELQEEGAVGLLENIASVAKIPFGDTKVLGGKKIANPFTMLIDYGKNMTQNFITGIAEDNATTGSVLYGVFIDSGFETIYESASGLMDVFGFDIDAVYEARSDKEGYEAVKDVFGDLFNELAPSMNWEGYSNGFGIMCDGIKKFGSDVINGVGGFIKDLGGGSIFDEIKLWT